MLQFPNNYHMLGDARYTLATYLMIPFEIFQGMPAEAKTLQLFTLKNENYCRVCVWHVQRTMENSQACPKHEDNRKAALEPLFPVWFFKT